MNSESIIISFIFIIHLFLMSWAVLSFMNSSYILYNTFFLISLLWGIHETKASSPMFVALIINVMSILLDAAMIGILYDLYHDSHNYRFVLSAITAFLNLFLRLVTSFIIYCILAKRRENDATHENMGSVMNDFSKYWNFSRSTQPPPPPQRSDIS